jgi:membrane fusion protein, multidrug efflux system
MKVHNILIIVFLTGALSAQSVVETTKVVSKTIDRQVSLTGEFFPYLRTDLHAKVSGFVERVDVDRGSVVKEGQLLLTLSAPEMTAQLAEAESKVAAVESQRAEAEAKLVAALSTYERLKAASETPGVVAVNDVMLAEKTVDASRSSVRAIEDQVKAATAAASAVRELQSYLRITAPFDGIITERNVHPGALVGPGGGQGTPLLKIEQISRLRLTVAVPEVEVGGLVRGARVSFAIPAYPGQVFTGVISRISHTIEMKTRTMPVELDVQNTGLKLSPGMYPEVRWPFRRTGASLLVPPTSIVTTTERSFVIRLKGGVVEWVSVTRGTRAGDLVEVYGALHEGDVIVRRGTDEIREGTHVQESRSRP